MAEYQLIKLQKYKYLIHLTLGQGSRDCKYLTNKQDVIIDFESTLLQTRHTALIEFANALRFYRAKTQKKVINLGGGQSLMFKDSTAINQAILSAIDNGATVTTVIRHDSSIQLAPRDSINRHKYNGQPLLRLYRSLSTAVIEPDDSLPTLASDVAIRQVL